MRASHNSFILYTFVARTGARLWRSGALVALAIASAAVVSGAALALAMLASATSPSAYPHWSISRVNPPFSRATWNGSRLEWLIINQTYATASDSPTEVLRWFKERGWMGNFRYDDSVIRQTEHRFGWITLSTVEEIFVGSRSLGAYITSSTQTVITVGR